MHAKHNQHKTKTEENTGNDEDKLKPLKIKLKTQQNVTLMRLLELQLLDKFLATNFLCVYFQIILTNLKSRQNVN